MIRCAIFDLDGTLLDTLESLTHTVNLVMKHFGYGSVDEAHIRKFVGDGYRPLVERALRFCGDEHLEHYEEGLRVYERYFAENCLYHVRPYEGIRELLAELKARGIRLAVLSNKPHAQTVETIAAQFGEDCFDLVAGERPGIPKKPDPAGVHLILREFGVKPEECLYFGDTNTDMKTGTGAGLITAGVTWGFRDREELESFHPQYVIDTPGEILKDI